MKIQKGSRGLLLTLWSILVVLGVFSLLRVHEVKATTCNIPFPVYVAAYKDGIYLDGFSITYATSGDYYCDSYPVIFDDPETESILMLISQRSELVLTTGVYLIDRSFEKISDDVNDLYKYRLKVESVERIERNLRNPLILIVVLLVIFIIFLLIIYIPWKAIKRFSNFKDKRNLYLKKVIPLQVLITLLLWLYLWWSMNPLYSNSAYGPELLLPVVIFTILFIFSIVIEILYLIIMKIKSKPTPN